MQTEQQLPDQNAAQAELIANYGCETA